MKVGIITHYYKSENYGGNLQAFALCKAIQALGYDVEQISLDRSKNGTLKRLFAKMYIDIFRMLDVRIYSKLQKRKKAILKFNKNDIPHSKTYTEKTICACKDNYDAFITGSDQVWHPNAVCDAYLLKFVPSDKIKLSYAASIAKDSLTDEQKQRFKEALNDYKAVSVREEKAVKLLEDISPKNVELTLDPTLLLTKEEWLEIVDNSYEDKIKEDYLFCYFLGDSVSQRRLADEYAKKHNLKIVNLPHLIGKYRKCDRNFGDYQLYDVTPNMLLSLIKNAKCIFTDSFHATVFSLIFEKEHFVFERNSGATMNSRIYNLVSIFNTNERFCDTNEKESLAYIEGCQKIDYSKGFDLYKDLKSKSIEFLKGSLQN